MFQEPRQTNHVLRPAPAILPEGRGHGHRHERQQPEDAGRSSAANSFGITGLGLILPIVALAALTVTLRVTHAQPGPPQAAASVAAPHAPLRFVETRPLPGVPEIRHSRHMDTSRSGDPDRDVPRLYVLVPDRIAVTTQAQPSLFWYLSRPTQRPIRITLSTPDRVDPVLIYDLDGSTTGGIQRVDLTKWSVRLQAGVRYEWVVTLLSDPKKPANNPFAKCQIWRMPPPSDLEHRYATAGRRQKAAIAAEEGIWIDALAYISDLIDHRPDDPSLRRDRADLLRQVDFDVTIQQVNNRPQESIAFRPDPASGDWR